MIEEEMGAGPGGSEDEEIIEKKPSAPTATVLMILTTLFLGFAIYLVGDEIGFYFNKTDYEKEYRADWYYSQFKRRDARPERAEEAGQGENPVGGR